MDSFDAKMTLGKLLTQLQPYRPACMEICLFLLKNSNLQEELYPVILETLRRVNLNVRLNILQFIDDLVTCVKEDVKFEAIKAYSLLLVKDLRSILELVIPKGESETRSLQSSSEFGTFGLSNPSKSSLYFRPLANLPPVYEILNHISVLFDFTNLLKYKGQYSSKLLSDTDKKNLVLRKPFDDEDIYLNNGPSSIKDIEEDFDVNKGLDSAWDFFIFKKRQSQYERLMIDLHDDPFSEKEKLNNSNRNVVSNTEEENNNNNGNYNVSNGSSSVDTSESLFNYSQKQLLERIENDRERQKRGKESLWKQIRPNGKINIDEFNLILNKSNNWLSEKSDLLIIKDMNSMWIDSKINVSIPNEQRSRQSQQQQQHYHHQQKQQQQQQHMLLQQQHRNQQNWNQHPQYDYYNDDYSYQYRQPHNNRSYKNNSGPPTYDQKRPATKTQSSAPQKRRIYNKDITNKRQHNK